MKLYYAPGVCSLSPHIVLEEAGVKYSSVKTDIRAKTTEGGGDYKKTNPLGYVPALELDDGTILTEGPAIVQYIADKAPEKKLAPANGTLKRYKNAEPAELHLDRDPRGLLAAVQPGISGRGQELTRTAAATRLEHANSCSTARIT